jgi:hypothetical protein
VRPEKYASAIEQKKMLPITSVKGSVVIAPLHVPVSAGICFDVIIMTTIVRHRIAAERNFSFIEGFLRFVLRIVRSAEQLNLRTYYREWSEKQGLQDCRLDSRFEAAKKRHSCNEGAVWREATGTEEEELRGYGDPSSNAEATTPGTAVGSIA